MFYLFFSAKCRIVSCFYIVFSQSLQSNHNPNFSLSFHGFRMSKINFTQITLIDFTYIYLLWHIIIHKYRWIPHLSLLILTLNVEVLTTLPSKRKATLGPGAPMTPIFWVNDPIVLMVHQDLLLLLMTFWPLGIADPKLGPWGLLKQVSHFSWRGV